MTKDESIKNADTESLKIMIEIFKEAGIDEDSNVIVDIKEELYKRKEKL